MVVAKDEGCGANPESPNFKTPKQRCDRREICTRTSRLPAPEARPENSSELQHRFRTAKPTSRPGSSQVGTRSYSRKWRDYLPSRETAKEYSPRREPRVSRENMNKPRYGAKENALTQIPEDRLFPNREASSTIPPRGLESTWKESRKHRLIRVAKTTPNSLPLKVLPATDGSPGISRRFPLTR